jgi:hypothetical protein
VYKKGRETLDHLLHCDIVRDLLTLVFKIFGVKNLAKMGGGARGMLEKKV